MSTHADPSGGDRRSRSIKEVLELLAIEFPDVTVSKIRFLESRGLICPERTASGYRKFDDNDVERLRWILRQQRENFLPLKVIKGRLEQGAGVPVAPSLFDGEFADSEDDGRVSGPFSSDRSSDDEELPFDDGLDEAPSSDDVSEFDAEDDGTALDAPDAPAAPRPRRASSGSARASASPAAPADDRAPRRGSGSRRPRRGSGGPTPPRWTAGDLAVEASTDLRTVLELDEYTLLDAEGEGDSRTFGVGALEIVRLAATLQNFGVEARHLRTFKHAAERESGVIAQIVAPLFLQKNPEARRRASEQLTQLVELGAALHNAFVLAALDNLEQK